MRFDKPLLAAVHGVGMGLGCSILGHVDLVLMDESARLRVPFAEMGVPPEAASSVLLPSRMGWQRAAGRPARLGVDRRPTRPWRRASPSGRARTGRCWPRRWPSPGTIASYPANATRRSSG